MTLELSKQARAEALASLRRFSEEQLPEPLGELQATLWLDFFLEEIAPSVYNGAIADAQTRLQQRIGDLSGELFADEFPYWPRLQARRKRRSTAR